MDFESWKTASGESDATYEQVQFMDPTRTTLGKYDAYLGGDESFEAFIETAMQQSRQNWNWDYHPVKILEYFNEGFSVVGEDPKDFEAAYNIGPAERNHTPGGYGLGV